MAVKRDRPYAQFNFLVDLGGGGGTSGVDAGFQECSNIGTEVTIVEYRNGNDSDNHVHKGTGLNKATDVTMKRGIVGSATLYTWLDQIRNGQLEDKQRTVRISLMSEDHQTTVATWVLNSAQITKYVSGPFNAKGGDIAMEELTLTYEKLTLEDAS